MKPKVGNITVVGLALAMVISLLVATPAAAESCDDPVSTAHWTENCLVQADRHPGSNLVLAAQYILKCNGYKPGPRDGMWSNKLRDAILDFQTDHFPSQPWKRTARLDDATWEVMRDLLVYKRASGSYLYFRAGSRCTADRFAENARTGLWKVREEATPATRSWNRMSTECGKNTTASPATIRKEAAALAIRERNRWNGRDENDPTVRHILNAYWDCGVGYFQPPSTFWSSAFISYVMRWADAGPAFTYTSAHRIYIGSAKQNREANKTSNPFWAFRPSEKAPAKGDLVCKDYANRGVTYENVDNGTEWPTHCDIVVEVQANKLVIIGGNVGDTVNVAESQSALAQRTVSIDGAGKVTDGNVFAVVIIRDRS